MSIDYVRDLPDDAEMVSNSQDIKAYLKDFADPCVEMDYVGCLFVDAYAEEIWLCEDEFPANNDPVWMIYPKNEYCS